MRCWFALTSFLRDTQVNGKAFGAHTLPTDAVSTIAEEYQQHSTVTWTFNSYYPSVVAVLPVMVNRNGLEQLEEVRLVPNTEITEIYGSK